MNKDKVIDVLILVPLKEEFIEVSKYFELEKDYSALLNCVAYSAKMDRSEFRFLIVNMTEFGNANAQMLTQEIISKFDVKNIICIGIAGAISSDLKLLDVVVSSAVYDVNERQKITKKSTEFDTDAFSADDRLYQRVAFFNSHPNLAAALSSWQLSSIDNLDKAIASSQFYKSNSKKIWSFARDGANVYVGAIVSGPVGASKQLKIHIKSIKRKMMALETESGGVFRIANEKRIPCITIRGICDFADEFKNSLEDEYKDVFRRVSIQNASALLKILFTENPYFSDRIQRNCNEVGVDSFPDDEEDVLAKAISESTEAIEEHLKTYSAEFRAKPKGYQMPVPRLLKSGSDGKKDEPIEPVELITADRICIIEVPTNYPEKSLPWVFADYYIKGSGVGHIVLPIVVNFDTLGPPNRGLSKELDMAYRKIRGKIGIDYIYLIHGIKENTKHRMDFFINELLENTASKIILIGDKFDLQQVIEDQRLVSISSIYRLVEVSFHSLTKFLCATFEMQSLEAESIALKLRGVFRKFDIQAHPSYFAGIPREAIAELMKAHRRAELINIAVNGYLTYCNLVDKQSPKLSITTRREFLKKLVYRMYVDRDVLRIEDVLILSNEIAVDMDFDIDSIKYVNSFFDSGLLDSNGNNIVSFSLPFVRSYLLAEAIAEKQDVAVRYFDFEAEDFDQQSYDIFCEIHHSEALYEKVLESLSRAQRRFSEMGLDQDIFISEKISPKILLDSKISEKILNNFQTLVSKIVEKADNTEEKQQILDDLDDARASSSRALAKSKLKDERVNTEEDDQFRFISISMRSFMLAVMSLAAGSEKLNANDKRNLCNSLLELGNSIISVLMSKALELDIDSAISEFKKSSFYEKLSGILKNKEIVEFEKIISRMFQLAELEMLTRPFMTVQFILGDNANNKLLYKSVSEATTANIVDNLIKSIWLCEIDPSKGFEVFSDCLKSMPQGRFLRTSISQYLLSRAFWTQASAKDKECFVDGAIEAMKPLNGDQFNKRRQILELVADNTSE